MTDPAVPTADLAAGKPGAVPRTVKLILVATTPDDDLAWLNNAPAGTPWIQDRFGPEQAGHQETVQAVAGNLAWHLMAKAGVAPR